MSTNKFPHPDLVDGLGSEDREPVLLQLVQHALRRLDNGIGVRDADTDQCENPRKRGPSSSTPLKDTSLLLLMFRLGGSLSKYSSPSRRQRTLLPFDKVLVVSKA